VISNPNFSDLVQLIGYFPNIHIETDLGTYPPHLLAAWCDACIAMLTSLGDEMLAAGKKVLFYDYYGIPSGLHDYEGYPIIARSYEDLSNRMRRILEHDDYMPAELHRKMLEEVFGVIPGQRSLDRLHTGMCLAYREATA